MPQLTQGTHRVIGCLLLFKDIKVIFSSSKLVSNVFWQSVDWIFYFLYGTHCLMHTWACYNLCSRRWQWKCVFIIAVLFFCLCLTFLAYQYKYVCVHGLNAATSQDVLLGLRPVIRRLNLLRISFLFFVDRKGDVQLGAVSCKPEC